MKLIDLLNESSTDRLNERLKPITKKHWDKADEDQRLDWLLQAFREIGDAEKYVDYKWNNLPSTATQNMYESVNEKLSNLSNTAMKRKSFNKMADALNTLTSIAEELVEGGFEKDEIRKFILDKLNRRLNYSLRESVNEVSYKVAGRPVELIKGKKSDGTDWKVKFKNGKTTNLSDVLALIKPFPKGIKESAVNARLNEGWMDLLTYGPLAVTAALSALSLATDTAIKDMPSKAKDAVSNFNLKSILKSIKAKWRKYTNSTVYEIIQKMVNDPDIVNASKNLIKGPRGGRRPDLNNAAYLKALKAKLSPQEIAILKNFLEKMWMRGDIPLKGSEVGNTKSFQSIQKYTKGESVNEAIKSQGKAIKKGDKFTDEDGDLFTVTKVASNKIELKDEENGYNTTFPDDFDDDDFDSWFVKESVNEAMGAVDFKDGLVDYIGDNPKLDNAYNSMKNPKDFMKLLITTIRNDKKAKKLYSYFSKNRTKGALDIIQKLASGDI